MSSYLDCIRRLSADNKEAAALLLSELATLRQKQLFPLRTDYRRCAVMCGRAWGKSRMLTAFVASRVLFSQNVQGLMVARNFADGMGILWGNPESGLARLLPKATINKQTGTIHYPPTNATIKMIGSSDPDKARGLTNDFCVVDEAAYMTRPELYDDIPRTMRGKNIETGAQMLFVSTPMFDDLSRKIIGDADLRVNGSTMENDALPKAYIEDMQTQLTPTQYELEVLGRIPEDIPSALFPQSLFKERVSMYQRQPGETTLVSIDPAATSGQKGSNTGCAVVTQQDDTYHVRYAYRWQDHISQWADRAAKIAYDIAADFILIEGNLGDAYVEIMREAAARNKFPPEQVKEVKAHKSKIQRLERSSTLFIEGRLLFADPKSSSETNAMRELKSELGLFSRDEEFVKLDKNKRNDIADATGHAVNALEDADVLEPV